MLNIANEIWGLLIRVEIINQTFYFNKKTNVYKR